MKKLASLVLALIMVFSVAGTAACAENAPVEIEFFTNRSFEGAAATDLEKDNFVEQYLRENLGVDIRYVYTDELTTSGGLLLTGLNSVGGFSQSGNTAGTSSGMETLRPAWD